MTSNKRAGHSKEAYRLVRNRIDAMQKSKQGFGGTRFYASLGIFDIIYVDKNGITHLEQVKSSRVKGKMPVMPKEHIIDIKIWIEQWTNSNMPLWIGYVLAPYRRSEIEVRLN